MSKHREAIKRQYRVWRAMVGLTQQQVEQAARKIYPEFPAARFTRIEKGFYFPTPSERKALAKVLKVAESELPAAPEQQAKAS